mmetsp:Transcript_118468/g.177049  ORF Transcript_118468/g.177049 Transcript_118468/m.177049 type:complete len:244 (+) Transcript_118468:82-813(+)
MSTATPAYTPITQHGELTKILDDVYVVDGSFNMALGVMLIQRTMTIVKRGDELTIFNSMRLNESVEAELKKLGTVKHLVRMAPGHGCDDGYYLDTYKPTYWSLEGMKAFAGIRAHDKVLGADGEFPVPEMKMLVLKNAKEPECVLWIPDSGGTLITCDFIQNYDGTRGHSSWLGHQLTGLLGFSGVCKCVPLWRSVNGEDHWHDVETLLSWDFENLIPAHGRTKVGGAKRSCEQGLKESFKKT